MPVEEEEEVQERTLEDIFYDLVRQFKGDKLDYILSELSDTDKEIIKSKLK
jgi:hypothetical protein